MKTKKQYIIIGFILISVFIAWFSFVNLGKDKELPVIIKKEQIEEKSLVNNKTETEIPTKVNTNDEQVKTIVDTNNINVTLVVLDKTYNTNIEEKSSVFDVMEKIQREEGNNFDFEYKEYPSLGIFIDEIKGIKGISGKYWIYYVNNIEASVGVSNYILKDGDSILWVQE